MKFRKLCATLSAVLFAVANNSLSVIYAETAQPESALLDITQFKVLDENLVHLGASYLRDVSFLFDDQDKVPASAENTSVDSEVFADTSRLNWTPNQQSEYGGASCYIDFGANYVITGIAFLDTNGTPVWTISDGHPFGWNEIAQVTMDSYNWWHSVTFDNPQPTRYLHLSADYCDSGVSEIALYGYKHSELSAEQKAVTAPKAGITSGKELTAGGAVGFNAFIDDPMTAIMSAGNVREYHNFSWLIDSEGKVKFDQGTWGDMDSYYSEMKKQNIDIIPCFQGGSPVVYGESEYPEIPVAKGADTLDPESYAVHAQAMYQVAVRYGSNKDIDPDTINISGDKEAKVGLGLLNALENCNEPNKSWSGKASYFTPYELASMCSADYDGHEGTIPNAGVKTADENFRLAVGGLLTTPALFTYLDEMKAWFDYNRSDGKFAVDILNVHMGPDTYNPEDSDFRERIAELQKWIDENAPGTELWISEFETAMADCEVEGVDNHDNENYQLKYAQRVARTYLEAIAQGTDRITKFQLRDEGEGVYYNSGLVTGKGEWEKKLAWYYVSCMTTVLENADFTMEAFENGVKCLSFEERDTGDTIMCLWSPTSDDTVIEDYTLSAGDFLKAYLTVPSELAEGTTSELAVEDGAVTVDVSETPVYITFSDKAKTVINGRSARIAPESICLTQDGSTEVCDLESAPSDSTLNQFYRMFDEPHTMPDPVYGSTAGLENPQTNVTSSNITCYVQFDGDYVFNGFAVYDTYGTGGVSVYDAYTDELLWSDGLGSYMSKSVSLTADSAPTDCLKIVKNGGDLNELAFYGYRTEAVKTYDLNSDGSVDVFDFIMLRKALESGENDVYDVADLAYVADFLLCRK